MPEKQLKDSVAELHAEIGQMDNVDDHAQEKLDKLVTYSQLKLEHPDDPEHHQRLAEHLSETTSHFEVTHPKLTAIMNQVMMTLSNTGM